MSIGALPVHSVTRPKAGNSGETLAAYTRTGVRLPTYAVPTAGVDTEHTGADCRRRATYPRGAFSVDAIQSAAEVSLVRTGPVGALDSHTEHRVDHVKCRHDLTWIITRAGTTVGQGQPKPAAGGGLHRSIRELETTAGRVNGTGHSELRGRIGCSDADAARSPDQQLVVRG